MNAFLNIICLLFDFFRVILVIFSVTQEENVDERANAVIKSAAAALVYLICQEQMLMPTSI